MISVCVAVFNGERHLEEQLRSILGQLANDDEVIIVDDCSIDGSVDLIKNIHDPRITVLLNGTNVGPNASFERAFSLARGKYIFLSDQDDIWKPEKVATTCQLFRSTNALVIVSDARVVNQQRQLLMESLFRFRGSRPGFWPNLYKNGFVGCCMAVRAETKSFLLPFPRRIVLHDEWIGLCSSVAGHAEFTAHKLIDYRRHGSNLSPLVHGSLASMLRKRLMLLLLVMWRLPRIVFWRFRYMPTKVQ
jgi:glycosyltransferase involved in cell wall biosynthesis